MCLSSKHRFLRSYETKIFLFLTGTSEEPKNCLPFSLESHHSAVVLFSCLKSPEYFDVCRFINSFCFLILVRPLSGFLLSPTCQTLFGELFFGFFSKIHGADDCVSVVRARCLGARDYGYFQCVNPKGIGQRQSYPLSEVLRFLPEKKLWF